jgi:hypothetical protein
MIEQLKFMDDLKEIQLMVEDQQPRYTIVDTIKDKIAGYQKEVDEFDKWAEEESKKQENMAVPDDNWQDGGVENFG